jgi:F-type H+-transporting ATPase subunit b
MQQLLIFTLLISYSSPAWAGGGSYVSQTINLLLLLAIFFLIGKKNLPPLFKNRAQDIEYNIQKGQKELDQANQRNIELKTQLDNLNERIEAIQKQAEEDINSIEEKINTQLADERRRIQESTKRSIADELSRAKTELQKESVEISVELASELLKQNINEDDHQRLSQSFVEAVAKGEAHG